MLDRLKKLLFYGDVDREVFQQIYPDITAANRKNLSVFLGVTGAGMLIMALASWFVDSLVQNRLLYVLCTSLCVLMFIVIRHCRDNHGGIVYSCVYVFSAMLLMFAIALGTFVDPTEVSASLPVMMFVVPLLFADKPYRTLLTVVAAIIAYCVIAAQTQVQPILGNNLSNVLPYGAVSLVVGAYMMRIKIKGYALEYENRHLIETDQLTGMLNRRSFDQHMERQRRDGCTAGMRVCAFDVNGLKKVNDNLGHHAGDELIRGAANAIEGVFGAYGNCYRTGGDEFMAVIGNASPTPEELTHELQLRCSCFNGAYVTGLSISVGIVTAQQDDSIDKLIKRADALLYEDKDRYYRESGAARR